MASSVLDPESSSAYQEYTFALHSNDRVTELSAAISEGLKKFPEDETWASMDASYKLQILGDIEGYLAYGELLRKSNIFAGDVGTLS